MNAAPRNSAIRKNRSLANEVSMITIASPHSASFPSRTGMASSRAGQAGRAAQPPRQHEHVHEDGRHQEQLHPAAPFDQRVGPAGVLQDAALLDHRDLGRPARGVDRDPAVLDQDDHEERDQSEQVGGQHHDVGRGRDGMVHQVRVVGRGDGADGEEHQDQRGLGHAADPARAAGPESAVGACGVEARQRDHETGQREHEGAADQVGEERQRQRLVGDDRHDHRHGQVAGERHERGAAEHP